MTVVCLQMPSLETPYNIHFGFKPEQLRSDFKIDLLKKKEESSMRKRFFGRKLAAIGLTLSMVFSMGAMAFASDTDPNMTNYATPFTTVVNQADLAGGGADVELMAGPAGTDWKFTGFSTEVAANQVRWSVVDGSTTGVTVTSSMALNVDTNQYVSYAVIHVDANAAPGSASILAKRADNNAFVNFTVLVNPTKPQAEAVPASFQIYGTGASAPLLATGTGSVLAGNYISDRNFVTVADSLLTMLTNKVVANYDFTYGYVRSFTIGETIYTPSYPNGWQYRIYRSTGGNTYKPVDISSLLGIDDINLQMGDIVQWRMGSYSDTNLFPAEITR